MSIPEEKVSIVIPVYNSEKFLENIVGSILSQTYKNLEVIFVDDGSIDRSLNILEKYARKDERIKIICLENSGPARARNMGMDNATGKYICFFDSDDYVEPDIVESFINIAETKSADLVICGFFIHKIKNGTHMKTNTKVPTNIAINNKNISNIFSQLYLDGMINSLCNKMFKLDIIKKNNLRMDEMLFYSEDTNFVIDYFKYVSKIAIINKPYYHIIRRNISSLTKKYHCKKDLIYKKTIENMQNLFGITGYTEKAVQVINMRKAQGIIASIFNLFHKDCQLTFRCKYRKIKSFINDDELIKDLKAVNPQSRMQKLVFPILKTGNTVLVYIFFKILKNLYDRIYN